MDATNALREIRDLMVDLDAIEVYGSDDSLDGYSAARFVTVAGDLLGKLHGLDQALSRGGYLPGQWSKARAL